jgi:hypothetical protein
MGRGRWHFSKSGLGKNKKLFTPVLVRDEAEKHLELGITVGIPVPALLQHCQQGGAIGVEVLGKLRQKAVCTEPEAPRSRPDLTPPLSRRREACDRGAI